MNHSPEKSFVDFMLGQTVRLVRDAAQFSKNSGIASGLLICREPRILLLTAGHIFNKPGTWTLETAFHVKAATLHLALEDLQLLSSLDLSTGQVSKIDLAWAWIDKRKAQAGLTASGIKDASTSIPCYQGPLDLTPTPVAAYGFAAWTQVEFHPSLKTLLSEATYEINMTYSRSRSDGVYVFELNRRHQGHPYYEGASGAPVADEEGRIVGLLLGGCQRTNELYVAPLARYSSLFLVPPID